MKCSYQSGYKFDQASLQLKVVVKLGDQYLSGWCAFPARTTPDQSFKKVREISIISLLA